MQKPLLTESARQVTVRQVSTTSLISIDDWIEECVHCRELPGENDGELERRLNVVELTLLGIGACIGAGIFVLTGAESRIAGPSVALAFLLAALSSIFNGFCFAELASRLPISGSAYLYAYCMFGELPALIIVVNQLVDYHIGAATLARSLVAYLAQALDGMGMPLHECVVGCQPFESAPWFSLSLGTPLVLAGLTCIVARGAETNAVITAVITVVKLAVVVVVIFVGAQRVETERWQPFFPLGISATMQAAATLNYAFIGYAVIANAAEECANPSRDIPRAITASLLTCAILYVSVSLVLCGMQSFDTIDVAAPVSIAFIRQGMPWVASLVDFGSCAGMTTGLLAGIYGQSRIYFAMSRDRLAPSVLKDAPICAVWCGVLAAVLGTVLDVKSLASFLNIGVLLAYAVTAASVLLLNTCHRKSEKPLLLVVTVLTFVAAWSTGDAAPLGWAAGAALVVLIAWVHFVRGYACGPATTFHCPGMPATPLIALVANIYLVAHLSVHAWLRLLVVSLLVVAGHSAAVFFGALDTKDHRRRHICDTVQAAAERSGNSSHGLCHDHSSPGAPTQAPRGEEKEEEEEEEVDACPDPVREYRLETGACVCRQSQTGDASSGYVSAGGACVSVAEFDEVNVRFPEASAARVVFLDLIGDNRQAWWKAGPFGNVLGIEVRGAKTMNVLGLDAAGAQSVTVTSAVMQWLYVRCGVGCIRGNATACQCISNLCVLMLYDDQATVCRFLKNFLYEGKTAVQLSPTGQGLEGMPWLYYSPQRPLQTLEDTSLSWKFTLSKDGGGKAGSTGTLVFWLASYSLEGSWLGWQQLQSQLDLCAALGGTSSQPQSPASAWRRFGSSMRSECEVLVSSVLQCGSSPVFYDLFVEDVDGSLLPVPVRILNTVKDNKRPNLNSGSKDVVDDVLVRRFSLCDAVSGKDGGSQAYPGGAGFPSVVRWAAHAAIQVSVRPNTDGRIYMPVLSLAYADKRTDRLSEDDTIPVSFTAEYSMDPGNYWTVMTALLVLVILCILALAAFRVYLVERRYPSIPMPIGTIDPSLFAPKAVIQMLAFCSTVYSGLFWFHFVMALYWLITFKAQNVPHLLLPSALDGGQYEPHDVIMVIVFCFGAFTVSLGLWKQLRVFFFLVDW
ncbi:unnamed protein product, partial [Polarella glacialis]